MVLNFRALRGTGAGAVANVEVLAEDRQDAVDRVAALAREAGAAKIVTAGDGDFGLLRAAHDAALAKDLPVQTKVGLLFSSDSFYNPRPELASRMAEYGALAVEMEASALYTLAAKFGRRALAVCTVSDHILTGEETTAQEREQTFGDMVTVALEAMLATPLPA